MGGADDDWQVSGFIWTVSSDKLEEVLMGKENEFGLELVKFRCLKNIHEETSARQ